MWYYIFKFKYKSIKIWKKFQIEKNVKYKLYIIAYNIDFDFEEI